MMYFNWNKECLILWTLTVEEATSKSSIEAVLMSLGSGNAKAPITANELSIAGINWMRILTFIHIGFGVWKVRFSCLNSNSSAALVFGAERQET